LATLRFLYLHLLHLAPLPAAVLPSDAGFALRATSDLPPAATLLLTTPLASLPPSAVDPALPPEQVAAAVKKLLGDDDEDVEEEDSTHAWWELEQWYNFVLRGRGSKVKPLFCSLEQLLAAVPDEVVMDLACQLRTKFDAGDKRVKVRGLLADVTGACGHLAAGTLQHGFGRMLCVSSATRLSVQIVVDSYTSHGGTTA
jgi:hypothetical protein